MKINEVKKLNEKVMKEVCWVPSYEESMIQDE
jgi:hypothetical protein